MAGDFIRVPPPQAFFEPINWHRTALHEIGHLVGRQLGRDLSGAFGSKMYAYEEIVCELSTSFVCAALGIVPTVRHADYIGAWAEILQEDNRAIVRAASAASKASDYLLAFLPVAAAPKVPQQVHQGASGMIGLSHRTRLRRAADREEEGGGESRDGPADAGRVAPGRPVAENQPETLPWPSRNPRLS